MTEPQASPAPPSRTGQDESLETVKQALDGLRFGTVAITIHEGRVVQIDVTEKRRFSPR